MKGYKPRYLRKKNIDSIVNMFKRSQALTVADVYKNVDLSKTTIINIVSKLSEIGLLVSNGKGQSTSEGGKKPLLYLLNHEYAYCVSMMSKRDGYTVRVVNMALETLLCEEYKFGRNYTYEELLRFTSDVLHSVLHKLKLLPEQLYGIAYHCSGIVDNSNSIIIRPMTNLLPMNCDLANDLGNMLGFSVPIFVENSARCAVNYELSTLISELDATVFVINISIGSLMNIDDGIGGGLIVNGRVFRGLDEHLSEVGHMLVDINSPIRCKCGNFGCLETFIEAKVLNAEVKALLPDYPQERDFYTNQSEAITFHTILQYAAEGSALASHVCDGIVNAFSAMFHNILLVYGPKRIIIQSEESESLMRVFIQKLKSSLGNKSLFEMYQQLRIDYSYGRFEMQANLGSASFCRDNYLDRMISEMSDKPTS